MIRSPPNTSSNGQASTQKQELHFLAMLDMNGFLLLRFSLFTFKHLVFFSPEIYSSDFTVPLPEVVDKCIQSAPIDTRRALYKVQSPSLCSWIHVI
jgi:hypothetical protein